VTIARVAAALLIISLSGCSSDGSAGLVSSASQRPSGSVGHSLASPSSPSSTLATVLTPPAPSPQSLPSARATSTPSQDDGPVVVLSDKEVAGVAIGTAASEAERRLRAVLGAPTYADDEPGCNGEKGRHLIWGEGGGLVVWMLDEGGAGAALSGWAASKLRRFDYRFPYSTRLGESAAETMRRVPRAKGMALAEGEFAGRYIVTTPERPGLVWRAARTTSRAPVVAVDFNPVGCD
jgi:hypothetical protein